jgi:hypothetical protein
MRSLFKFTFPEKIPQPFPLRHSQDKIRSGLEIVKQTPSPFSGKAGCRQLHEFQPSQTNFFERKMGFAQ